MRGYQFSRFNPNEGGKTKFDQLLDIFLQLINYTSGDVSEALSWLNELDKQYGLTDDEYGMGDFLEELRDKGYIADDTEKGEIKITPKSEQTIRKKAWKRFSEKLRKQKIRL